LIQTDRNFQDQVAGYCTVAFSVNVKVLQEIAKAIANAFLFCALTSFWTAIAHGLRNSTKSSTPYLHGWPVSLIAKCSQHFQAPSDRRK
jgi:hypothetical protein